MGWWPNEFTDPFGTFRSGSGVHTVLWVFGFKGVPFGVPSFHFHHLSSTSNPKNLGQSGHLGGPAFGPQAKNQQRPWFCTSSPGKSTHPKVRVGTLGPKGEKEVHEINSFSRCLLLELIELSTSIRPESRDVPAYKQPGPWTHRAAACREVPLLVASPRCGHPRSGLRLVLQFHQVRAA